MVYRIYHIPTGVFLRNADMYSAEALIEFTEKAYAERLIDQIITINNDFANATYVKEEFDIIPIKEESWPVTYVHFDELSMDARLKLGIG
jgi:hypothetical protein